MSSTGEFNPSRRLSTGGNTEAQDPESLKRKSIDLRKLIDPQSEEELKAQDLVNSLLTSSKPREEELKKEFYADGTVRTVRRKRDTRQQSKIASRSSFRRSTILQKQHSDNLESRATWSTVDVLIKDHGDEVVLKYKQKWSHYVAKLFLCCTCCFTEVLQPNHPWVEKWDLVMVLLLTYVACVGPYDTAYLQTRYRSRNIARARSLWPARGDCSSNC